MAECCTRRASAGFVKYCGGKSKRSHLSESLSIDSSRTFCELSLRIELRLCASLLSCRRYKYAHAHTMAAPLPYLNNNNAESGHCSDDADVSQTSISDFFEGQSVLVTGGTGFVGKALIEKLLRVCARVETIYVLIRPKPGLGVEQRLKNLIGNSVFDRIRDKDPRLLDKIIGVAGDVSKHNLGLNEKDKENIIGHVGVVFHSAATVRFTENLKNAVILNTLGTKMVAELCSHIKNLKSFVHVSTAFSNADKREVQEVVYDVAHNPTAIIDCMQTLPAEAIQVITKRLIGNHPNSYTFTKALAECLVLEYSAVLPAAIVRPSIITASWKEPFPGWVDNIGGITGIMMECGRGTIRSIVCDQTLNMDLIPVDVVADTLIAAAWHTAVHRSNTIRVYNCTSSQINAITWKTFGQLTVRYALEYPSKYVSWYPGFTYRTNRLVHLLYHAFFHCLPACVLDVFLYCTRQRPMMLSICRKIARAAKNGEFFALNQWKFGSENASKLIRDVGATRDGHHFHLDVRPENGFRWEEYVKTYLIGIRKHVLKDDMSSLERAKARLNRIYWAGKLAQVLAVYALLRLLLWH